MPPLGATRAQIKAAEAKPLPLPKAPAGAPLRSGLAAGSKSAGVGRLPGLTGGIPKAFEGAPRVATAFKNVPAEKPAPQSHGGGGLLGALESAGAAVIPSIAAGAGGGGPALAKILKPVVTKGVAIDKAIVKNPGSTLGHTFTSVPGTLNAMVMGPARTALETGAELVKAGEQHYFGHAPSEVLGVKAGQPGEAIGSLAHSIVGQYKEEYGHSLAEEQRRAEAKGFAPEALEALSVLGGASAISGRALSEMVDTGKLGASDFAKVQAYRDAKTRALQSPTVERFLERKDELPSIPTRGQRLKAAIHESATEPRPNLRQASGVESASIQRGAAVVKQDRSPNLFRAFGQTKLDDARRAYQQASLQRVMDARKAIADNPHLSHDLIPQTFASQLAYDTRRGEVTPLLQRGGITHGRFVGAEQAQRIGAAYSKGENVRGRGAVADRYTHTFNDLLKNTTKQQKAVLVHAKEGMLDLNDPARAAEQLREIHDQAIEGRDRLPLPIQHVKNGADVAREAGSVLDYIDKHGADRVFTPAFARLVETIPDERLTSFSNPVLLQHPDEAIARKYLPQQHFLAQWAERHPDHPDAPATKAAVEQIHRLLEEGKELRNRAVLSDSQPLHDEATDKFATAKNLADENARAHGLPTDRAYIQHTTTLDRNSGLYTVANRAPGDYAKWEGMLQKAGYRSTDPELVMRALAKSVRDDFSQKNVNAFKARFAVKLPRTDMTAGQVAKWLADTGRNPADFQIVHLGRVRDGIGDQAAAEHLAHLNSDPEAHARAVEKLWQEAAVHPGDTAKGADAVNKAAYDEMVASYHQGSAFQRAGAKVKGEVSKLILGTSPGWLATMGLVTYPVQSLMGGAGPFDALAHFKYYRSLSPLDKTAFDQMFGVDSPFRTTSHGIDAERMGNAMPDSLDGLVRGMKTIRESPMGKLLSKANPVKAVIAAERIPRRGARINVAMKGLKNEAIRQMMSDMHAGQQSINRLELATRKLMQMGRMPAKQYMEKAMANREIAEQIARHANNAMGEWHNMKNFERTKLNKVIMFYPWLRYSLKLAARTLPAHHPLLYAAALKLGEWEHRNLVELLGTDPEPGTVYLNKAQPGTTAAQRQWAEIGMKQANPTLNTAMGAVAGKPSELLDMLPPYYESLLGWATNKNLFTDKPLKGSKYGESKESKESPSLAPFMARENLFRPFAPARALESIVTGGKPQSATSLPLLGRERPVQYSAKTERELASERSKQSVWGTLAKELLPLLPHGDEGRLAENIRIKDEEAKEARKDARKEATRQPGTPPPPPPPPPPPGPPAPPS